MGGHREGYTKPWTTLREIVWLASLGDRELWVRYLESMHKRSDWAGMDPAEIELWLRRRLASCSLPTPERQFKGPKPSWQYKYQKWRR